MNAGIRSTIRKARGALIAMALSSAAAYAHHSFAMYAEDVTVLEGTVVEFQWINPHTFVDLDVPTSKGIVRYSLENGHPGSLKPYGWKRTSLKPGDKIKVRMMPLRSGKPGGLLVDVSFPDGRRLGTGTDEDGGLTDNASPKATTAK